MFERFNHDGREAVVFAQDEARSLRHDYIGTEHLLLGLLRDDGGVAAQILQELGITLEATREAVARIAGGGSDEATTGQIPFTPRAKKVLELSLREALALNHNYIGTEHLLLGVVREHEGVAARILLEHDLDAETIRDRVLEAVGRRPRAGRQREEAPPPPAPQRRWEYRIETWPPPAAGDRMELLGRLGSEGWELAGSSTGELIFKRPARPHDPGAN